MASNRVFHVYALLSPDDGLVYYVGKICKIGERFRQHVQGAQRLACLGTEPPFNRRERWLYDLALQGREPELALLDEIIVPDRPRTVLDAADREARKLEKAWIGRLRNAGHPLTNFNSGKCGNDHGLIETAAERDRNLALSLGRCSIPPLRTVEQC